MVNAIKNGSGASLADLLDLAVLLDLAAVYVFTGVKFVLALMETVYYSIFRC